MIYQKLQDNSEVKQDYLVTCNLYRDASAKLLDFDNHLFETNLGNRGEFVAKTLYDLTEDEKVSVAGLLYTISVTNSQWYEEVERISKDLNSDVYELLNTLKKLRQYEIKKLNHSSSVKNLEKIEGFIRLIFVASFNQDNGGFRALVIELVYRLARLKLSSDLEMKNPSEEFKRFALETFKIFVPIANRLSLWKIKWQLEDFSFKAIAPEIYCAISALLADSRLEREHYIEDCVSQIRNLLETGGYPKEDFEVTGRSKTIYSTYSKMKQLYCYSEDQEASKLDFDDFNNILLRDNQAKLKTLFEAVHDLYGIRVLVKTVKTQDNCIVEAQDKKAQKKEKKKEEKEKSQNCYKALSLIESKFHRVSTYRRTGKEKPLIDSMVDYIACKKENGYQSIHTVVLGPLERKLEIQIRTYEMNLHAEYGVAAHWKYKELGKSQRTTEEDYAFTEIKKLIDNEGISGAQEFLQSLDNDLFGSVIYLLTPKEDIKSLPQDSTPIDFAYRIHTEVGNHCTGARVNGRIVTLDSLLKNGDIVEIMTQKNGHPSLDWLNFVKTSGAKNRIRQWYKRSHRDENVARGRDFLEKELGKIGLELLLKSEPMQAVALRCNYHSVEDLLAGLGYGELTSNIVVNRLRESVKVEQKNESISSDLLPVPNVRPARPMPSSSPSKSPIAGVEGLMYHLAGCCNPIPCEAIIGIVTRTRGISIHRQDCSNTDNIPGDRLVPVSWKVNIQIEVLDRVGVLNDVLSHLKDNHVNVRSASVKTYPGFPALIGLCVDIQGKDQFERTCMQIRKMSDVLNLRRISEGN